MRTSDLRIVRDGLVGHAALFELAPRIAAAAWGRPSDTALGTHQTADAGMQRISPR